MTEAEQVEAGSLAERKRRLVRAGLAEAALGVLGERGFDGVTIDDLAQAAGISRRTFFRYFPSKEEVVISAFDDAAGELVEAVRGRPASEAPLLVLRHALTTTLERFIREPARTRALLRLIQATPALRAQFLDRQDRWREELGREVARRLPAGRARALLARLAAAVALGTVDAALAVWTEDEASDLSEVLAEAFDALSAVVALPRPAPRPRGKPRPAGRASAARR
jgi:AcrR family transcriptional regulator